MPTTIRQLKDGQLAPVDYTAETLAAAADYQPDDGVYTVAITVETFKVLKLTAHLDRLQDSAQRENIALTLTHAQIRAALREVIEIAGYDDAKFRITVPRTHPDEVIITAEPFTHYPEHYFTEGVKVVTAANSARHNPGAKDSRWMQDRKAIENALPLDVHTAVLLDADGNLLEGTSSNFYAVMDGQLYTAVEGVLPGTSQQIVFETVPDVLPLLCEPANLRDLPRLQEAFITSSSRWVMPVVQIDDTVLGDGTPGPHTRAIRQAFLDWTARKLEEI